MVIPSSYCKAEVAAARFTDPRLHRRLQRLLAALQDRPAASLPQACQSWAATKAAYRFLAHPPCRVANLLPAFVVPSVTEASRADTVVVPHDTTTLTFTNLHAATGLGFVNDSQTARGFHLHSSLLLDRAGRLLGPAHLHFWVRKQFHQRSRQALRQLPIEHKESFKWVAGLRATPAAFQAAGLRPARLIHLLDREGDVHEVFAEVKRLRAEAVIRCYTNRKVAAGQAGLPPPDQGPAGEEAASSKHAVAQQPALAQVKIQVPAQGGGYREAVVEVRSKRVRLLPNHKRNRGRRSLWLGLIEIREVAPPAGEEAVRWWLWTTLPTQTVRQVLTVLGIYHIRWRLEEYHRALKTGCQAEKLRLQSVEELMSAVTLKAWVACRIVRLRDQVQRTPQASCRECFSDAEWQTLWAREHPQAWQETDAEPTLADVVKWLGRLGGHLGRSGDGLPGVELLGRGLEALTLLLEGRAIGRREAVQAVAAPSALAPPAEAPAAAASDSKRPPPVPLASHKKSHG
jgi:hypothetical protein